MKIKNGMLCSLVVASSLVFSPNIFAQGKFDLGVGLGIPYGILGVNAEYYPLDTFSLSGGVGTTILAGVGYDVALNYYFGQNKQSWIPRISVHYGTNGILETLSFSNDDDYESFEGVSVGVGVKRMMDNSSGFAFDVFYIASSDLFDRVDELREQGVEVDTFGPERFKIGVGYVYRF